MKGVLSRQDARFDFSCPALMAPMCRVLRLRVSDLGLVSDYCLADSDHPYAGKNKGFGARGEMGSSGNFRGPGANSSHPQEEKLGSCNFEIPRKSQGGEWIRATFAGFQVGLDLFSLSFELRVSSMVQDFRTLVAAHRSPTLKYETRHSMPLGSFRWLRRLCRLRCLGLRHLLWLRGLGLFRVLGAV